MMEGCPVKFRILEFVEDSPKKNIEIMEALSKEYKGYDSKYGRAKIKYDCIELASAGILNEVDHYVDEEGVMEKGKLIVTYTLSGLGKEYLQYLKDTVKPQKV